MTHEDNAKPAQNVPSKGFVALLYVPLLVPALLPMYFALDQTDPVMVGIMIGTSVAVLVFNAVMLIVAYRWFARGEEQ